MIWSGHFRIALLLGATAAILSACTSLPGRNQVEVQVGQQSVHVQRAEPYAALYLPYAMMSALAYAPRDRLTADLCPDLSALDPQSDAMAVTWLHSLNGRKWRCLFGVSGQLPCPRHYPDCRRVFGLELQVWRRTTPACEVAIAIRGANVFDPTDWPTLRWLFFGNHEEISSQVEGILARSVCRGGKTRIVAVGHSLGGGIAEQAAYASSRIRYVYGFNQFPAIGVVDLDPNVHARNKVGLGIDRAAEAGGILALPRLLLETPATSCNPRIRVVQFHLAPFALPIDKHKIDLLTINMLDIAQQANPRSVMAYRAAAVCH